MKKFIAFIVLNLAFCGLAFAQSPLAELEKAREIKLLESTREDVRRILKDFEHDKAEDEDYEQTFSTENAEILVSFARGDCSHPQEYWNIDKWLVTRIKIEPENDIKINDFKFDFTNFTKEIEDENSPENYIYQNEVLGIVFRIYDNKIEGIYLFPSKTNVSLLCENENTEELISGEQRFVDVFGQYVCILINRPATVDDVILDKKIIIADCVNSAENNSCSDNNKGISVTTLATDPENDVLTYSYEITGGRIIGAGAKVIWDLTDVKPGTYTITVGVDDGCGICTPTKTQTVVLKECSDCSPK